jgi:hypothetical protein
MAEHRNATLLQHRRGVGGTVKIDFDNLLSPLRFWILVSPAHESGRSRRERKDVLSAFAVASATKVRPSFAVQRGLKPVYSPCLLAPINFKSAEGRDLAKVDLGSISSAPSSNAPWRRITTHSLSRKTT